MCTDTLSSEEENLALLKDEPLLRYQELTKRKRRTT